MELALQNQGDETPVVETNSSSDSIAIGAWVGPYRIVRKLGEGGMGLVYLAEQEAPLQRSVALKVIKRGMETEQVVARFAVERQALAVMDHAAIANVHDAGETADGRPYFIMEYIDGIPINEYCDQNRLSTVERLELLTQVCDGVQHAHRKGIIHRDIKPTNVLVAEEEGRPVPKIIDFGIAKAIEQRLTERSLFTDLGVLVGTPEYMSPEQADLSPLDVDTRTDVYSLGILLYELLTGALPFEPAELRRAGFDEIRRRIREEQPSKPSTRISSMGARASGAADVRQSNPATLRRRLSGDLDVITMKALEKDPARRYESPAELSADIHRHLSGDPLLAQPPSKLYSLRRFIARNKTATAVVSLFLLTLLGFSIWMSILYSTSQRHLNRALGAETEAASVSEFLIGVFEVSAPSESLGNSTTARQLLDQARDRIKTELKDQPDQRATILHTLGRVYGSLGLYDDALGLNREVLEIHRVGDSTDDVNVGTALLAVAQSHYNLANFDESEALLSQALSLLESRADARDETATAYEIMCSIRWHQGRYDEALDHAQTMFDMRQALFGPLSKETAHSWYVLGNVHLARSELPEAEHAMSQVMEIQKELVGEDHPDWIKALNTMAELHRRQGRYEDAERLFLEIQAVERKLYEPDHPQRAYAHNNLGLVYRRMGRSEEAVAQYLEAIRIREASLPENHPLLAWTWDNLGLTYLGLKRFDDAADAYETARLIALESVGPESPDYAVILNNTALLKRDEGKTEEAVVLLRQVIAINERTLAPDHTRLADPLYTLGKILGQQGQREEGVRMLQRSLDITVAAFGPEHPDAIDTAEQLEKLR